MIEAKMIEIRYNGLSTKTLVESYVRIQIERAKEAGELRCTDYDYGDSLGYAYMDIIHSMTKVQFILAKSVFFERTGILGIKYIINKETSNVTLELS